MPVYPHSHTFIGSTFTTVISGPYVQVIHTSTGDVVSTTAGRDDMLKAGPVRCAAVDKSGRYLATSGEDKQLKIWEIEGLKLLSERQLPKRPTKVAFTADGQTILVADKFGDIFRCGSYPFQFTPLTVKQKKDALSSHENPSGGQLILGHASLLNAFLLSVDERYIITADRDEHIRVSWYPQGYNIEMYCLGHTKFVSAIHNPAFAPTELISGGGDAALKIWDWMTGTVKHEINIWDTVEPHIKVCGMKRRRGEDEEEPREGTRRGKGKKAKSKGKAKAKADQDQDIPVIGPSASGEREAEQNPIPDNTSVIDGAERVLVVHKIETVTSEAGHFIIFSAVGATALFTCLYPDGTTTPNVHSFDLGRPIVNFVISDDDLIWVFLDASWSEEGTKDSGSSPNLVQVLKISAGEVTSVSPDTPLFSSLNEKCQILATANELKKLDIYGDLTTMPKNTDTEQDQGSEAPDAGENTTGAGGKQVSKKELGRLKSKQAVLAKVQAGGSGSTGTKDDEPEIQEPESKKSKSDHGNDLTQIQDVSMDEVTA
ncbi:WD40-repeat-containing domain protein [Collybia nuda]|uniref:WD40-repeat-containing domain protein n=1 Tax=Collybia nuda TaxID=64659 RepID=A0A9P5Y2Q9_9AGAR|nr:WD40-repeat-containing domain protein [Collybia nuda]